MFIQTETTPNPDSMRFFPGFVIMDAGKTAYFADKSQGSHSPLAGSLLKIEHVTAVFFCDDFITVTKNSMIRWEDVASDVMRTISIYFSEDCEGEKRSVFAIDENNAMSQSDRSDHDIEGEEDSEVVLKIKKIIDEKIRPAIAQDGGSLLFVKYVDNIVYVTFQGACVGCPSSIITLKQGIESMLKYYIDEIQAVEQVV